MIEGRQRENKQGRGRESERETQNPKQVPGSEPDMGLEPKNLSHLGTPQIIISVLRAMSTEVKKLCLQNYHCLGLKLNSASRMDNFSLLTQGFPSFSTESPILCEKSSVLSKVG